MNNLPRLHPSAIQYLEQYKERLLKCPCIDVALLVYSIDFILAAEQEAARG